jgi:hypothetical protein
MIGLIQSADGRPAGSGAEQRGELGEQGDVAHARGAGAIAAAIDTSHEFPVAEL